MSVRRESGVIFIERRLQERNRLLLSSHWQYPQVRLRLLIKTNVDHEAAIPGPVARPFPFVCLTQQLIVTRTTCRFLEEVSGPVSVRYEYDSAAIRRP